MNYKRGDKVRVVDAIDRDVHDVSAWIGRAGIVKRSGVLLEGLVEVTFAGPFPGGRLAQFWPEELEAIS